MIRLWTHEILRVFYDRLVDDDDCQLLFSMVKETIKQHFGKSMDQIFTTIKRDGLPIDQELLLTKFLKIFLMKKR